MGIRDIIGAVRAQDWHTANQNFSQVMAQKVAVALANVRQGIFKESLQSEPSEGDAIRDLGAAEASIKETLQSDKDNERYTCKNCGYVKHEKTFQRDRCPKCNKSGVWQQNGKDITEGYTKKAVIYPDGGAKPYLTCVCNTKVDIGEKGGKCPKCGTEYDGRGYIQESRKRMVKESLRSLHMPASEVQRVFDEVGSASETEVLCNVQKLRVNNSGSVVSFMYEGKQWLREAADRAGWKTVKTIPSHVGKSRFYDECDTDRDGDTLIVGYVKNPSHIPSPYSYSPSRTVYRWKGKDVVVLETKHKNYEVIEVPSNEDIYPTDEGATNAYIKSKGSK